MAIVSALLNRLALGSCLACCKSVFDETNKVKRNPVESKNELLVQME